MQIDTVTIRRHNCDELPTGHAYHDDGPHIVIVGTDGLHFIPKHELSPEQLTKLNPTWANGIYYPEVAP